MQKPRLRPGVQRLKPTGILHSVENMPNHHLCLGEPSLPRRGLLRSGLPSMKNMPYPRLCPGEPSAALHAACQIRTPQ